MVLVLRSMLGVDLVSRMVEVEVEVEVEKGPLFVAATAVLLLLLWRTLGVGLLRCL